MSLRSSRSSSRTAKSKKAKDIPPAQAFSERFSSIFFSLYNPQRSPDFTTPPIFPAPPGSKGEEKLPKFESPLCTFKVTTELEDSKEEGAKILQQFNQRSAVLVAEMQKPEYNIEVSMLPYDVERSGSDRITESLGKKRRGDADKRSVASSRLVSDASSVSQKPVNHPV
jgi:hypothetical protein